MKLVINHLGKRRFFSSFITSQVHEKGENIRAINSLAETVTLTIPKNFINVPPIVVMGCVH